MANNDCTEEQLLLVNKFFAGLHRAKARPVDVVTDESLPEEDQFLARLNAEILLEIDVRIPKEKTREVWLEELRQALHTYISNTDRDTEEHHKVIDTLGFVNG